MANESRLSPVPNGRQPQQDFGIFGCEWQRDLQRAGVEPSLPRSFRLGVPALTLTMLAVAALVGVLFADPGRSLEAGGLVLLGLAALPWIRWSPDTDDGPNWTFATIALTPLAALGFGQWSGMPGFGLGSDLAYLLATFLILLTVLLYVAFAEGRVAAGVTVAAYAAYGLPLVAGGLMGQLDIDATGTAAWQMGFAFCVAAGYGIRFSYHTTRELADAREALALQAMAEDRRRVARDIHDVVAHTLAVMMLHVTAARMAAQRSDTSETQAALEEAEQHGRASLADVRRIVRLLRSNEYSAVDPAQPGLADVESLIESYRAAGLPVDLSLSLDGWASSPSAELTVYRVLQEALTNAARHGNGPATVQLRTVKDQLTLHVDNPVLHQDSARSQGSGLIGMQERVSAVGGTIEAGPRRGRWVVSSVVPNGARA